MSLVRKKESNEFLTEGTCTAISAVVSTPLETDFQQRSSNATFVRPNHIGLPTVLIRNPERQEGMLPVTRVAKEVT